MATKKAFIVKSFSDAGTERNFTASTPGDPKTFPDIEEGHFGNYEHAGLVRVPTDEDMKGPSAAEAKGGKTAA